MEGQPRPFRHRLRPQILAVVIALLILGILLIINGHLEGAVGVAGLIGMIGERILQSQDTPTVHTGPDTED